MIGPDPGRGDRQMRIKPLLAALAAVMAASAAQAQSDVVRLGVSNDRSGIYSDLGLSLIHI